MGTLREALATGAPVTTQAPWPRVVVDAAGWSALGEALAEGALGLSGLWGEAEAVHAALFDEPAAEFAVATLACPEGRFPSLGRRHAAAIRPERAIRDLVGLVAQAAPDDRPWLDHGRWPVRAPLGRKLPPGPAAPYAFLPAEGEGLHRMAVGPVHAGIIEPGHFRFAVNGETVVRLETRLGYTHKGIEALMQGATIEHAACLAGRVSGDSTVAYALAFARAAEAALGVAVPERAHWLRALMAELERLANHLGDIGAICNDAGFALMLTHCAILRERVLRTADACFGHRLMRDLVVPGGVALDLAAPAGVHDLCAEIGRQFPRLVALYEGTASLQDRTCGTGVVAPGLARRFAAGGYIGRASGRDFDARRRPGYPPYDQLRFEVPVFENGDVDARVWVRIREVEQSLSLLQQILLAMPGGPVRVPLPLRGGEGVALVEGFRGDILVWLSLDEAGRVRRCHLRDPSWFQWPLVEAAIEGNIVADFPLCNKSFNCSYSGHDL
ncbi:MAG: nickel-dependent hydrogenase large subunit [Rhodospirillales bacterium]|nr:nickel-dependent hydrogenase large subunit [Rhodospirillales bacterium]